MKAWLFTARFNSFTEKHSTEVREIVNVYSIGVPRPVRYSPQEGIKSDKTWVAICRCWCPEFCASTHAVGRTNATWCVELQGWTNLCHLQFLCCYPLASSCHSLLEAAGLFCQLEDALAPVSTQCMFGSLGLNSVLIASGESRPEKDLFGSYAVQK